MDSERNGFESHSAISKIGIFPFNICPLMWNTQFPLMDSLEPSGKK